MSVDKFTGPELVPGSLRVYRHWGLLNYNFPNDLLEPSEPNIFDRLFGKRTVHLKSHSQHTVWTSSEYKATCIRHSAHEAPHETCGCGIWAYYTPDNSIAHSNLIFGAIEVTGRVLMGTKGVRAEKAKILALAPRTSIVSWSGALTTPSISTPTSFTTITKEVMKILGEVYTVPTFPSPDALVAEFPPEDISELVPPEEPYPLMWYELHLGLTKSAKVEFWSDGRVLIDGKFYCSVILNSQSEQSVVIEDYVITLPPGFPDTAGIAWIGTVA